MKKNYLFFATICLSAMVLLTACNDKFPGYRKTADGLYYKFYHHDASAQKPNQTDFVKLEMACYLDDSLYYDWRGTGNDVYAQLNGSKFAGDLHEAYAMMHVGDSASFYIKADSIAVRYYDQDPDKVGLKPEDYFRYEVKLVEVKTQEEFKASIEGVQLEALREQSEQAFWDYLKENNITEYTASGLFFSKSVTTQGAMPQKGQTACIKFVASYLDGVLLGTSDQLGEVYEVAYGEGKVLRGLEEGIGLMRVGEKARLVLPYTLAYGSQAYGSIPPYSNLVFDVELIEIK